jgi:hypothetical protein
VNKLTWILLFIISPLLVSADDFLPKNPFYSIESVVSNLTVDSVNQIYPLDIPPPEYLYHWLSLHSLDRLLPSDQFSGTFPMKNLGDYDFYTMLVREAPMFLEKRGLFAWHNPVGALNGGLHEIYGNHEALLALKLKKNLRIGLVVTAPNSWTNKLIDPKAYQGYDLILNASGYILNGEQKLEIGFKEWVLINPDAVESFAANPEVLAKHLKTFEEALKKTVPKEIDGKKISALEILAGPQHEGNTVHQLDAEKVKGLADRLDSFKAKLPKWTEKGWVRNLSACEKVYQSK